MMMIMVYFWSVQRKLVQAYSGVVQHFLLNAEKCIALMFSKMEKQISFNMNRYESVDISRILFDINLQSAL